MTEVRWHYALYGLQIGSTVPLEGLPPVEPIRADDLVHIDQATPPDLPLNSPRWRRSTEFTYSDDAPAEARAQALLWSDDGAYMQWRFQRHMALMFARDGTRLYTRWSPGVSAALRAFNIFGPGMGMVLKLRGLTALHASVVAVGSSAIALAGVSGAGKSTLAAAFEGEGCTVLSDDLCVLMPSEDRTRYVVPPGAPRVRLLPDAAAALYGENYRMNAAPDGVKLEHDLHWLTTGRAVDPLPIAAVYLITGRAQESQIESLAQGAGLFALLGSTYLQFVGSADTRARDFRTIAALVAQVPVMRLSTPQGHKNLKKLCRALIARHS